MLQSVVSSLSLDGEGVQDSGIKSLTLGYTTLDISDFLVLHRFPKLRVLRLSTGAEIISWDHLKIQATSLTTLSLGFPRSPDGPTTSQLLSVLASYPNLQDLSLGGAMVHNGVDDGSAFRVPLRQPRLSLMGDCHQVSRLLQQLEYPDELEWVHLNLSQFEGAVDSESLGPYLRDRIQRDDRFRGRLGIKASCTGFSIVFGVNVIGEHDNLTVIGGRPSVSFWAVFKSELPQGASEKLCTNLIAVAPRDCVVHFTGEPSTHAMRDLFVTMPNIDSLHLKGPAASDAFLRPDPLSHTKLPPSLRRLRPAKGRRPRTPDSLPRPPGVRRRRHFPPSSREPSIPPEVVREIEGLVEEFIIG